MTEVKQKVSDCFSTMAGDKDFAAVMPYLVTAAKHGKFAFQALHAALQRGVLTLIFQAD